MRDARDYILIGTLGALAFVACIISGNAGTAASKAHAQEAAPAAPPTDAQIEQMERDLRDAYEARRKDAQDAGDDAERQHWLIQRRAIDLAISNREGYTPTPLPPEVEPPIVDPPVVDPSTGWLARAPHTDAEYLLPGADLQAALNTGRDVLLPAGSEWPQAVTMVSHRQLLGVYGVGDRPLIPGVTIRADDITVAGLRIANDRRNPDAHGFDLGQPETTGVYVTGEQRGLLVEDCVIEWLAKGIVLQGSGGGLGPSDCTIHRNIIRYNWNKGDRGAGIYTNRARNLTVTENLIDHNGWHPAINADRSGPVYPRGLQAHGCYFSGRYNSGVPDKWDAADNGDEFLVEFHGNIVSRSSANGAQFRLGGNVSDNVFVGNPMGLYTWTNASQVHRNAILNGTHVDYSDEFYQRGWGIQIITGGDYTDNLIANVSRTAPGSWAVVYESGSARVTGNTFYNWRPDGKPNSVWDKNDTGLPRVTDNRDIIGGAVKESLTTDQIEQIAARPRGVWSAAYGGSVISAELREVYE